MSALTQELNRMTACELITWIASQRPELSIEKVEWQLRDILHICNSWLAANQPDDHVPY